MPTVAPAKSPDRAAKDANTPRPAGSVALLRRKCACGGGAGVDGACERCRRMRLQRKPVEPGGGVHDAGGHPATDEGNAAERPAGGRGVPRLVQEVLGTPGGPLDPAARAFAEARFGQDFGHVRIHADDRAAASARAVDAHAYTVGHHVVFGAGRYAPETPEGRWLLAHELAHTVQQQGAPSPLMARLAVGREDDPSEAAADRAADAAMAGRPVPSLARSDGAIRRQRVTRVDNVGADEKVAHLDNGTRLRITRTRWLGEATDLVNWARLSPGIDRKRIWLDVEWCAGQNHGSVRVGANVPEQVLQTILKTVTSGGDIDAALRNVSLTPFVETTILQSGSFRVTGSGEITISREGQVTGGQARVTGSVGPVDVEAHVGPTTAGGRTGVEGGVTVTVTPGRGTATEDCRRRRTRIVENTRYACVTERDIPARDVPETVPVVDRRSRFVYFEYARDAVHARSAESISSLTTDLGEGFQVAGIRGFTSPEGPMAAGRRFMGNEELARRRAAAAARVAERACAAGGVADLDGCFVGGRAAVSPTGEGELYTLTALDAAGISHEVEGAPLAEHAVGEFLTHPAEEPHRTPETTARLEAPGTTAAQKADLVYPLLRRAEITLTRRRMETRTRHIEASVETSSTTCPETVIDQAFPAATEGLGRR